MRIWHAFFGLPGSLNDINVLQRSHVFDALAGRNTAAVNFTVNGHTYNLPYYLADKIYPDRATLVKTKSWPSNNKDKTFALAQEGARKDIERTFGGFRKRFRICMNPGRFWSPLDLNNIVKACIILHDMIVEDERHLVYDENEFAEPNDHPLPANNDVPEIDDLMQAYGRIQNRGTSLQLQNDLVEHHWELKGLEIGPYAKNT